MPFGPGAPGPVAVHERIAGDAEPDIRVAHGGDAVVDALRRARTMRQGRTAAVAVTRDDWDLVAVADLEEPLPGYARRNLAIRIDCPRELREQFGSHPKFSHRLTRAGILDGPRELVADVRTARRVLSVLAVGRRAFPHRPAEALELLRPLVQGESGGDPEAWAVCAQLLPTFDGTLPELVTASGAVATGVAG
ncbi:hypothetical protein [Streptomyces inhibens]|uniref:hypothetical protein n=1 Tax=Streptomyces inhibens TaxID=2293571 RepID=UPI001EE75515|nr:hypothetical protein [Streptomyces inhibens]UKY53791.1 hypothetical protein KI385_36650 [Streptomyces inhibens]